MLNLTVTLRNCKINKNEGFFKGSDIHILKYFVNSYDVVRQAEVTLNSSMERYNLYENVFLCGIFVCSFETKVN